MAKQFGGKFSPRGKSGASASASQPDTDMSSQPSPRPHAISRNAKVDPVGVRSNLMFIPGGLLLLLSVTDQATGMALGMIAAGVWTGAAYLLREGLRATAAFDARRVARVQT